MTALLDTHALLWWLFDDTRISRVSRGVIADRSNSILVSAASAWEISTKYRLGKLSCAERLVGDMSGWLQRAGFLELAVSVAHAERAGTWPQPHRDPFDRILAAQGYLEQIPVISCDSALTSFGIRVLW